MLEEISKLKQNDWYHRIDLLGSGFLILISVGLAITFIVIANRRTLGIVSLHRSVENGPKEV